MQIEILSIRPFEGRPDPQHLGRGRGVANFNALIDGQLYIYRAVLRALPDGNYQIIMRDGIGTAKPHCLTLRDGPMRQALSRAVIDAYRAMTLQVAA